MAQKTEEKPAGKSPRRQQQRSLFTQRKLLDAALQAFAENGYQGTSTRDIAERAGVHHPLITYHFKNKEQLWRAAAERVFSSFIRVLLTVQEETRKEPPSERMAATIRAYVYYAAENPALHKVLFQESSHSNPRLEWLIDTYMKPLFEVASADLAELQEEGIAPPGDPALLFNMIRVSAGALLALSTELRGSSGLDLDDPAKVEMLADMIVNIYLPGRAAKNH
ncbi:MAG: TetR/AcrR family transcriptional regulator [Woeseia sp.]|nr:TetR/AcrR family transcriptional regulator [Woeseia sp.]MBT8096322.1 TetR/AcrR family transcriptional regulator [Woeseia sp.]NNE60519.1 TetR/AcrR family transcriptional regulator [Woeseia sp.]NNL54889.1 TetR/AcrR family transcriptional regulator [Woeseia sp.]